jgi:hypothetical protein
LEEKKKPTKEVANGVENGDAKKKPAFGKKPTDGNFKRVSSNGKVQKFAKPGASGAAAEAALGKKELRQQRKQKKLAGNYTTTVNIKKIWETLRRFDLALRVA